MANNYFEIFQLKPEINIDLAKLEEQYLLLQSQFHPDKFVNAPISAQNKAISNSMVINQAYKILKNDLKRAAYWLKITGDIDLENEQNKFKLSPVILMEIMELSEEFNEVDADERLNLAKKIKQEIAANLALIAGFINQKQFEKAAQNLAKAKYLQNIIESVPLGHADSTLNI